MAKFLDTHDPSLLKSEGENLVLFYPFVPPEAIDLVSETLRSRWIGQGPKVDRFELEFKDALGVNSTAVAVGSGTDGLHLAYVLAGISPGDEVISPVFTCTATNIPLLHLGATIRFADVERDTLNIDPAHVARVITDKTKAIVCVHYAGLPCKMDAIKEIADQHGIPVIEDAAQAVGASYQGNPIGGISDFTVFSFQATKHITTADGGMLMVKDPNLVSKARRLRWFGIDREAKHGGTWENDITEAGFKYQMTDVAAAMGLAGLARLDEILKLRRELLEAYKENLTGVPNLELIGLEQPESVHAAWLLTIAIDRRTDLMKKLREHKIESGQIHFRNDRYQIFSQFRTDETPNMDALEDRYLILPLHTNMTTDDVKRVCQVIRSGW